MSARTITPTPEHEAYWQALLDAIRVQGADIDVAELLALTAKLVGRLIAMQDQRRYTVEQVMQVVTQNLTIGNREVVDELLHAPGGHA